MGRLKGVPQKGERRRSASAGTPVKVARSMAADLDRALDALVRALDPNAINAADLYRIWFNGLRRIAFGLDPLPRP